jgi:hypothetical protein
MLVLSTVFGAGCDLGRAGSEGSRANGRKMEPPPSASAGKPGKHWVSQISGGAVQSGHKGLFN